MIKARTLVAITQEIHRARLEMKHFAGVQKTRRLTPEEREERNFCGEFMAKLYSQLHSMHAN